jgi:DNA excision repair protein ERCC-3
MSGKRTSRGGRPRRSGAAKSGPAEEEDDEGNRTLDYREMTMRRHHESKPIWVLPNLRIYLEAFSPMYQYAYDFLIAISEPVARWVRQLEVWP